MKLSTRSTRLLLVTSLMLAGIAQAQAPVVNIGERHGKMRAAQEAIVQAYHLIDQAQANNDGQLGGHAQKAKDLLTQADAELRQAANVSNREGR